MTPIPEDHRGPEHGSGPPAPCCSRRTFLGLAGGCAAHLALARGVAGSTPRSLFTANTGTRVVQEVPWGRLEEVAPGIWALVSTPLQDRTTLCNGGIVQGRAGVVMVEAFGSPEGAAWMARQARALTGRWPDHVVVTHYHGDHSAGLPGLADPEGSSPVVRTTATTRALTRGTALGQEDSALLSALDRVVFLPSVESTALDLGDRVVDVVPREGHTASDVTVEVGDPSVVFCGDLVWNRFFPNYVDAVPSLLTPSVRALRRSRETVYVPGHGPVADAADLDLYLGLLESVEEHARRARESGLDAEEAAAGFTLPGPLAEWFQFSAQYPQRALDAWLRELTAG
jgi:glyoxylase-like metal-dependent hydrolase (beta-lactamase superfamily II)